MNKERALSILCILLTVSTAVALAWNVRLQREIQRGKATPVQPAATPKADSSSVIAPRIPTPTTPASNPDAARRKQLEAENRELRGRLAEQDEAGETAPSIESAQSQPERTNDTRSFRGRRMSDEDLAELKETDPERYNEIEKQRSDFRERVKKAADDQVSFLASVDVSQWSAEHQENHARLLALIASMSDSMAPASPSQGEGEGDSRRRAFDSMREIGERMEAEQTMLLYDTAKQMGFDENGSKQFVDYIQTIQQLTSPRAFFGGRGGRSSRQRAPEQTEQP